MCVFKNFPSGDGSWPKYAVLCKLIYYASYSWSNRVFKYKNFINIHYYVDYNECLKIKNLFYVHTKKSILPLHLKTYFIIWIFSLPFIIRQLNVHKNLISTMSCSNKKKKNFDYKGLKNVCGFQWSTIP